MKRVCRKCSTDIPVGARLCPGCGGKDILTVQDSGEAREESGACEQRIIGSRNDPRETCGAPGVLRQNGRVMCDAHWHIEADKLAQVRAANAAAAEYCLIHGIDSPRQGHVNGHRLAAKLRKPPGKAWAYRLRERQQAGEKLLQIQVDLMTSAIRQDLPDEDKSVYDL